MRPEIEEAFNRWLLGNPFNLDREEIEDGAKFFLAGFQEGANYQFNQIWDR